MTLTDVDRSQCESYCFDKAWRLRLTPKRSRRLIRQTLELMVLLDRHRRWARLAPDGPLVRISNEDWLTGLLAEEIELEHRNPDRPVRSALLIWLLLQVILPIVVRLVIEWWLAREKEGWRP